MMWKFLVCLVALSEGKRHRHDHGLKELRSFIKHLHEEYEKPIPTKVFVMSDAGYRKRKAIEDQIKSYDIE